MTKELIISANVHEKKVSIVEDGVVTEFYVERRDENQGVVGNLYKGRVMKVLPGMQSAFVDIGLERDAFLYVSDFTEFMEEEEEIDFAEKVDEVGGAPAIPRQEERPRRDDRRRQEPAAQQQRPPYRPKDEIVAARPIEPVEIEDAVEQLAEIADESLIPPPPTEDEIYAANHPPAAAAEEADKEPAEAEVTPVEELVEEFFAERITDDDLPVKEPTTTASADASVEAEGVEEEAPASKARKGRSRKKAAEPEPAKKTTRSKKKGDESKQGESAAASESSGRKTAARASAKRPSRKRGGKAAAAESSAETAAAQPEFERVTDEDLAVDAGDLLKDAIVQEKIIEQVHTAEYSTPGFQPEPEPEWRVGSLLSQMGDTTDFERVVDESGSAVESGELDESLAADPGFRHIADAVPEGLYERAQSESGEIGDLGGVTATGKSEADQDTLDASSAAGDEEDREASVSDRYGRGEFSNRRGGRGRRRRREPGAPAGGDGEETELVATVEEGEPAEDAPRAAPPRPTRAPQPTRTAQPPRQQESRYERRPDGQRRPDSARPDSGQGRRPDPSPQRRPDRGVATISELLHEGQEILVQIAKEPIAKKGARITSHIALPGRYLVYMPTVNHVGVSRKIPSDSERIRLKRIVASLREREGGQGGFIARTACTGHTEQELHDDMKYLLRTWADMRKKADREKAPALVHRDLDLVQRILRDQLSEEFTAIRVDNEVEFARIVEFVNRVQPKLVKRVKLYTGSQPVLEKYGVQPEIDKAVRPRVWLKSGGYIVINQTEALVAIDVNTGKFVGKSDRLEDTITRTNLEAAKEIVRQVRLRDLGGIIVIDFIDMEERKNRQRVMLALQQELEADRAPSKILSINDFGLVAITRKRVKQSLERTLCAPCPYCQGAGMVKSPQTMCFEILEQAKAMSRQPSSYNDVMLRVSPDVAEAFRATERAVLEEIEAYFGTPVTIEADPNLHQEQYDFALL